MPPDQRRVIGGRVQAKALHVSNLAECARRYGANKSTKMLLGTVVEVSNVINPTSHRVSTFVTASYHLGGGVMKQTKLNIRSVKPAPPAAPPPAAVDVPPANPVNPVVGTPPAVATPPATPPANPVMPPPVPASPPPAGVPSPLLTPVASPVPPPVPPPEDVVPPKLLSLLPLVLHPSSLCMNRNGSLMIFSSRAHRTNEPTTTGHGGCEI
jgi:hypothetical protein